MNLAQEVWDEVMAILNERLTPIAIKTWFSECQPVELDDCRFIIHVNNPAKGILFSAALRRR